MVSISQLCDQGLSVNLNKEECIITNKDHEMVMKGPKSKKNCYLWIPLCISCVTRDQNMFNETVEKLPKLNFEESQGCEEKTLMSHKMLQPIAISDVLESVQVESLCEINETPSMKNDQE